MSNEDARERINKARDAWNAREQETAQQRIAAERLRVARNKERINKAAIEALARASQSNYADVQMVKIRRVHNSIGGQIHYEYSEEPGWQVSYEERAKSRYSDKGYYFLVSSRFVRYPVPDTWSIDAWVDTTVDEIAAGTQQQVDEVVANLNKIGHS